MHSSSRFVPTVALALLAACSPSGSNTSIPNGRQGDFAANQPRASVVYQVLHRFHGSDGANPMASLTSDASGNLYGTTYNSYGAGGVPEAGTVFKLTPSSTGSYAFKVLYSFTGTTATGGLSPDGGLYVNSFGVVFGTTAGGGATGAGMVFRLTPSGTKYDFHTLYSFNISAKSGDGTFPSGNIIFPGGGKFYGIANNGGSGHLCQGGCGAVYSLTPAGVEHVIYSFKGNADGAAPFAGLTAGPKGTLFGTTRLGGVANPGDSSCGTSNAGYNGCGTVFELAPSTNGTYTKTIIYAFKGTQNDGAMPTGPLVAGPGGTLYGTTGSGGPGGYGIVYKLTPSTSGYKETVLASYGLNEAGPVGVTALNDVLYVATCCGGSPNTACLPNSECGTIMSTPSTVLRTFRGGSDGYEPDANMIVGRDGALYGTTRNGGGGGGTCVGGNQCGTVFRLAP
jgi:uncharacterized repeat protein (TIGR03803 family)